MGDYVYPVTLMCLNKTYENKLIEVEDSKRAKQIRSDEFVPERFGGGGVSEVPNYWLENIGLK